MSAALSLSPRGRVGLFRFGIALVATLRLWHRRAQERRELARLNEHELHDFGVSPSEAFGEARKPFWRP